MCFLGTGQLQDQAGQKHLSTVETLSQLKFLFSDVSGLWQVNKKKSHQYLVIWLKHLQPHVQAKKEKMLSQISKEIFFKSSAEYLSLCFIKYFHLQWKLRKLFIVGKINTTHHVLFSRERIKMDIMHLTFCLSLIVEITSL